MGLFGPYFYKNGKSEKFFLHFKDKKKTRLYFFSKDPVGSMSSLPKGFDVVENQNTGMPFLRKQEKKEKEEKSS